jgi:sporulation protein YlmC with PRC-barrel domain
MTPNDLDGREVIGSDGKKIGNVKAIVSRQNSNDVHAVISSGGFLGIGSTDILVPLNELKSVGDKQLQAEFSQAAVDSQPKYATPEYENLDKDRPISEFFADNPSPDGEAQQARDRAKGQLR